MVQFWYFDSYNVIESWLKALNTRMKFPSLEAPLFYWNTFCAKPRDITGANLGKGHQCFCYLWAVKEIPQFSISSACTSSHNHGSVKNGSVSPIGSLPFKYNLAIFHWTMIMGERVVRVFRWFSSFFFGSTPGDDGLWLWRDWQSRLGSQGGFFRGFLLWYPPWN